MKTIIIEDEGAALRRLKGIVEKHPDLSLVGSALTGRDAVNLINSTFAELLLMDIQLKDMTAFEVLNKIEKDYAGKIIFITAYNNFAVKAFEVFAIDYVLKPYTEERLFSAIDRCLTQTKTVEKEIFPILESLHFPHKICIPEGKTSHLFTKDEIEWIKADGYHSAIHTTDGKQQLIRILLKNVDLLLPDNFIRISRSVIINKDHIASFKENKNESEFILKNGKIFSGRFGFNK